MTPYELQREIMRAHSQFYSWPRILGDAVRMRFFEALVKMYAHRIERRFERLSGWFVENLEGGLDRVRSLIESQEAPAAT
jgi:hypothetical protein